MQPYLYYHTHPIISKLPSGFLFVFGSNRAGIHGAGSAKAAVTYFGARYGQGEGLQGRSYALPTKYLAEHRKLKTLSLEEIEKHLETFIAFASKHTEMKFYLSAFGTMLAGYSTPEIAGLFCGKYGEWAERCVFPLDWLEYLGVEPDQLRLFPL